MKRLTMKLNETEQYIVEEDNVVQDHRGYSGEAVEKLAKFENFYDDLVSSQVKISEEMEKLRNEGKEKSIKFRELFGKKLMNNSTLIFLKSYGLE